MADLPATVLSFPGGCPDCGRREVELPEPLAPIGDDVDWSQRDYDGFRLAMLRDLAARFPERTRWTPADFEVVLVEILAAALDLLSDKLDRVSSEATLETARRPESVRRLLSMIGFDAARAAWDPTVDPSTPREIADQFGVILVDPAVDRDGANAALERLWERSPRLMDRARTEGPRRIRTNRRMVTIKDHADRLEDHPLVARASASARFTGSWTTISIALVTTGAIRLPGADPARARRRVGVDDAGVDYAPVADDVRRFHAGLGLPDPPIGEPPVTAPTVRTVLRPYLEAFRMAGQHVVLEDAVPVPVTLALSIRVASNHFRSEVRRAVETALGTGPTGFFAPGRLHFGEDLYVSDLLEVLAALAGVETVCVNRFKRLGSRFRDQSDSGVIELDGLEYAVCDNAPAQPRFGYFTLTLSGGRPG